MLAVKHETVNIKTSTMTMKTGMLITPLKAIVAPLDISLAYPRLSSTTYFGKPAPSQFSTLKDLYN